MSDTALWLDGNSIAGLLGEAFSAEMTTVPRKCQSCATISPVGAHRAYRGAGIVLRCPVCGDFALSIVTLPDRHIVHLRGQWTLELGAA
jgi:Family of unknown function (DUF6510)